MLSKKFSIILLFAVSFFLNMRQLQTMQVPDFLKDWAETAGKRIVKEAEAAVQRMEQQQIRIRQAKEEKQQRIRDQKEQVMQDYQREHIDKVLMKQRLADLKDEEKKITAEDEKDLEYIRDLRAKSTDLLQHVGKTVIDQYAAADNAERELNKTVAQAVASAKETQKEANKGAAERFEQFIKYLPVFEWVACGTAAGLAAIYYGGTLGYNYLNAKIGKPDLIRDSTRHDWKHGIKTWWNESILGRVLEEISLKEVILTPDMAAKMQILANDAKSSVENGLPFRHVLFYGLPGTGKTMFAKRLARYSDIDYAIMSGADFAQFKGGEGITEMHKLFDWAENSKNGLLIFIDEAEAFLRDRRTLNNEERNLVNAFLSRTGEGSDKFMIVLASNYEDELDPAVLSRIHKKINFPLPATPEREKIFRLYFDKYIINEERVVLKDDQEIHLSIEVAKDVTEKLINQVTQNIDGFSGREIEQIVSELRIAAYNIGNGRLTKDILNDVVSEKVKEHEHDMQAAKFQKERMDAQLKQNKLVAATA